MSSKVVIRIEEVSKSFKIRHRGQGEGLRHVLEDIALKPVRMLVRERHLGQKPSGADRAMRPEKPRHEEFWALRDISLEIQRGEVVGIIGRNGAGKSTLLKILSRITEPTRGRIGIKGRVASLLEVGTGFHPELTGRENIFLNGAILGMSRHEIVRHFDEIVDFASVEKFVDTPVKRYSSGMYVRLAFAVAAHLNPEILIIDEVLAVGDSEFQKKCLGKMREVASGSGRTILFVSHQLPSVVSLCSRVCLLQSGRVVADGEAKSVVEIYQKQTLNLEDATQSQLMERRPGRGTLRIRTIKPEKTVFEPASEKRFTVHIVTMNPNEVPCYLALYFLNENGQQLFVIDSRHVDQAVVPGDALTITVVLRGPWMAPGEYRINAFILGYGVIDKWEDACRFGISNDLPYHGTIGPQSITSSLVLPDFSLNVSNAPADSPVLTVGSFVRQRDSFDQA
jgi:lipopolysaccharide transport system ATP-binding protein